jgi:hypothetical protein
MDENEIKKYLNYLANNRKVSASTQNQALSVLLFIYRQVLKIEIEWDKNLIDCQYYFPRMK